MYNAQQQAGGAADAGNASEANGSDEVTDVDFEEVTDADDNNK